MQSSTMSAQSKQKSKVLGFILEFIIAGLGFLYAGAGFLKAALMFVIAVVLGGVEVALTPHYPTIALLVGLVSLLFFIYREVTLMQFIGRRNRG